MNFSDVPGLGSGSFSWTELYSGRTGSGTSVSATLGSHDIAVFKVIKSGTTTTAGPQTTTRTTTAVQATTTSNGGQCAAMWGQCGGSGWTVCRAYCPIFPIYPSLGYTKNHDDFLLSFHNAKFSPLNRAQNAARLEHANTQMIVSITTILVQTFTKYFTGYSQCL